MGAPPSTEAGRLPPADHARVASGAPPERDETESQRLHGKHIELLREVRVEPEQDPVHGGRRDEQDRRRRRAVISRRPAARRG